MSTNSLNNVDVWKAIAADRAANYQRELEGDEIARRESTPVSYQIGHTISTLGHTLIKMGARLEREACIEPCAEEYNYQVSPVGK
jgi:hypothetical protein